MRGLNDLKYVFLLLQFRRTDTIQELIREVPKIAAAIISASR